MYMLTNHAPGLNEEELAQLEADFNDEMENASENLSAFAEDYLQITYRRQGPFVGCIYCPSRCTYRSDVDQLLTAQNREWLHSEMTKNPQRSEAERYGATMKMAVAIAQSWVGEEPGTAPDNDVLGISYCATVHAIVRSGFNDFEQGRLTHKIKSHFFGDESR
jgi:hypothetical protein